MALTAKQEAYCQERANGIIQYESYLIAYPSSRKWKRDAVDTAAYRLEQNTQIIHRIAELKKPAEDILETNRNAIIQELIDIGLLNKKVYPTTVTALTNLTGKILPTKTENKHEHDASESLIDLIKKKKAP